MCVCVCEKRLRPGGHLSWSDVVAVAVGAATSSALKLTVVDLHTHFAITAPPFTAHTRDVSWTSVHTLSLHTRGIAVATWITATAHEPEQDDIPDPTIKERVKTASKGEKLQLVNIKGMRQNRMLARKEGICEQT